MVPAVLARSFGSALGQSLRTKMNCCHGPVLEIKIDSHEGWFGCTIRASAEAPKRTRQSMVLHIFIEKL